MRKTAATDCDHRDCDSDALRWTSRRQHPADTQVECANTRIGGGFTLIAGPCAVESERQVLQTAEFLSRLGVRLMRGGAFKPRSSPYSFQGLGLEGLQMLQRARQEFGVGIVTEVLDIEHVGRVEQVADVIQLGARSMQNYPLLKRVGRCEKPVLLKRGMSATIEEWLLAAEYVLGAGNPRVILCERGVRSFGDHARNVLDLSVVPALRPRTHLPVVIDPSHASGDARLVPALAQAALAAGADGLLIEVHPNPAEALCDGPQALDFKAFEGLLARLRSIAAALSVEMR